MALSLPVWGEWIEMDILEGLENGETGSLPVWGEWIEIRPKLHC